jgi:hypothetical protein
LRAGTVRRVLRLQLRPGLPRSRRVPVAVAVPHAASALRLQVGVVSALLSVGSSSHCLSQVLLLRLPLQVHRLAAHFPVSVLYFRNRFGFTCRPLLDAVRSRARQATLAGGCYITSSGWACRSKRSRCRTITFGQSCCPRSSKRFLLSLRPTCACAHRRVGHHVHYSYGQGFVCRVSSRFLRQAVASCLLHQL